MRHLAYALVLGAALPSPAAASPLHAIDSGLFIAKSSNKNQVHYALEVNDRCAPAGAAPVRPYWRMLERGANVTEPLTAREERAFGLERQVVDGDEVRVVLHGLPGRLITIRATRDGDRCVSSASTAIDGEKARISSVYVKLSLFGVSYVQLRGVGPGGASLVERVSP